MSNKKSFINRSLIITSFICLLPMILGFILWDKLPENIPQQYGWNNEATWSLPKFWGIITLPLTMVIINIFDNILLTLSKQKLSPKVENILIWIIPIIALPINSFLLLKPIGLDINPFTISGLTLSILFILLGNYLPKTQANNFFGVRAPYINNNPQIWNKTQKVSGIALFLTGIINFFTCFFPFGKYVFVISLVITISFTLVYSIIIAKKYKNNEDKEE